MTSSQNITFPPQGPFNIAFPKDSLGIDFFPMNPFGKTFSAAFYTPALTNGRAQIVEINDVLRDIEAVQKPFTKIAYKSYFCFIASVFVFAFAFIGVVVNLGPQNPNIIPLGILGLIFCLTFLIVIFVKTFMKAHKDSTKACKAAVERANQKFGPRGLRWHIPALFPQWVELWKDYYAQEQSQMGNYMLPLNQQPIANYGGKNQIEGTQAQYQDSYYQNNTSYLPLNQLKRVS